MKRIIYVFMTLMLMFGLCSCGESSNPQTKENSPTSKIIYDSEIATVNFIKVSDSVLEGMFDIYLKVENKSAEKFTMYLNDVSINGTMVEVGSGVPCDVLSGKNRTHGFFGKFENIGIASASEIKEISFSIWLRDSSMNEIETTEQLTIEL